MIFSRIGRIGGAGGYPTVRARVVSRSSIQNFVQRIKAAPDDHFTPCPDGSMCKAFTGHVNGARGGPCVIDAGINLRKRVESFTRRCHARTAASGLDL